MSFIPGLIGPAFALTIIALAQSAGISQAYVNPDGKYPDTSRDFFGQGAANVAGALFQGLPAGGALGGAQPRRVPAAGRGDAQRGRHPQPARLHGIG